MLIRVVVVVVFFVLDSSGVAITPSSADVSSGEKSLQSNGLITSAHVTTVLDKLHIPYTQSQYTGWIDITSFMTDKDSKEGNLLLDFLTFTADFRNSVSKNAFDGVMNSFKQHSRVEKNEHGSKKVFFDFATAILLITK